MKITDLTRRAFKNLRRNFSRTLLTMTAIGIGAFTLTLTLGVSNALKEYVDTSLQTGQSVLIVSKRVVSESTPNGIYSEYDPNIQTNTVNVGPRTIQVELLGQQQIEQISQVEGVQAAWPGYSFQPQYFEGSDPSKKFTLSNVNAYSYNSPTVLAGAYPADWNSGDIVVDAGFVETLGVSSAQELIGTPLTIALIDQNAAIQTKKYTIIGVIENPGSLFGPARDQASSGGNVVIGQDEAAALYKSLNSKFEFTYVNALVKTGANADDATSLVKSLDQSFSVTGSNLIINTLNNVVNAITYLIAAFSLIAIIVSAFGIINTQLMSVFERTKEIGLLKALGMPNSSVATLFSLESLLLGLIGSVSGALLAFIVQLALNYFFVDNLKDFGGIASNIYPTNVFITVGGLTLLSWFAGVIPARSAQKLDPIAALRYD